MSIIGHNNQEELRKIFDAMDIQKIGKLDIAQTLHTLTSLGLNSSTNPLFAILSELHSDENDLNGVNFQQFYDLTQKKMYDYKSYSACKTIFNSFSVDSTQSILLSDLKRQFSESGIYIDNDELKEFLQNNGSDYEITFSEFYDYILNHHRK
jgi:Ca2+-binding EF-hand superfamily protein